VNNFERKRKSRIKKIIDKEYLGKQAHKAGHNPQIWLEAASQEVSEKSNTIFDKKEDDNMGKKRKKSITAKSKESKRNKIHNRGKIKMQLTVQQEPEVDDTVFLEVMGKSPVNKVLDFLIENERDSWTMKEISEGRNVGYSTLKILLPRMIQHKLIIIGREIGKSKLYKINKDNEIIKYLYKIYNALEKQALDDFVKESSTNL
jgi:hypothetical protein